MSRRTCTSILVLLFAGSASFAIVGCTQNTAPSVRSAGQDVWASKEEYGHKQSAQTLTADGKVVGGSESESINLKPQPGDKEGITTLFVGHLRKAQA